MHADEIFADLNWCGERLGDCSAPGIVIVPDRLFDPRKSFSIERASALQCFVYRQRLIIIRHDRDFAGHMISHGANRSEILLKRGIAETELYSSKAALEQLFR